MSDTPQPPFDTINTVLSSTFEGPVYLTVEGATQEFIIKCFMTTQAGTPVQTHLRFNNEAMGQIFGGITKLVENGLVTLTPGEPRVLQ